MTCDRRKASLYLPDNLLHEIEDEAQRLDRSMSWVLQRAWIMARDQIALIPSQVPRMPA